MTIGSEVDFLSYDLPNSFFCELQICFDGRITETSASRALGREPEDLIMQAAMRILMGEETVEVLLDCQPGLTRLTFRTIRLGGWTNPMTVAAAHELACEISKTECDEATGAPVADTEVLGVAASAVQMARAAFFMGHERYGFSDRPKPLSLLTLEGMLNAIDGAGA